MMNSLLQVRAAMAVDPVGPVTSECGPKASENRSFDSKATQKHALRAPRRLPHPTQRLLGPKSSPRKNQQLLRASLETHKALKYRACGQDQTSRNAPPQSQL